MKTSVPTGWGGRLTAVILVAGLAFGPFSGAKANASDVRSDGEAVLPTPLPENSLDSIFLSGGFEELGIGSAGVRTASFRPPIVLPVRRSFWNTAENTLFIGSLAVFAGLNVADYILTREAQEYPELRVSDSLFGPIVNDPWVYTLYKLSTVALNTISLLGIHRNEKPVGWAMSLVTNLLVSLAVSNTAAELDRVRKR